MRRHSLILASLIVLLLLGVGGSNLPMLPHDAACPNPNHQKTLTPVEKRLDTVVPFRYNRQHLSPSNVTNIGFEWHWNVTESPHCVTESVTPRILSANEVVDLIDYAEDLRAIVRMGERALGGGE